MKTGEGSEDLRADALNEFNRELEAMQRLSHDFILKPLGFHNSERKCLVYEFMESGNLLQYLESVRVEPIDNQYLRVVLHAAIDICAAMAYVHREGYLHRDIKVENCLVKLADGEVKVLLADFGLARTVASAGAGDVGRAADMGSSEGTAPEVFSQKPYGKPADVFSFGIMLWIMISLGDPVEKPEGGGRFGVSTYRLRVSTSNLRPQRPEGCPPDLWDMMELCWHQVADLRPSFENLKDELAQIARQLG